MESASKPSSQLPRLTSEKIIAIQTLKRYGLKQNEIAAEVGCTRRQVQSAVRPLKSIGSRPPGPKPRLSTEQIDVLEEFVRSSPEGRTMSFLELSMHNQFAHWNCSEQLIRKALKTRGYKRYVARAKPPLTAVNKAKRLTFAHAHASWTHADWRRVLWTDESWVSGGRHTRTWVTRKVDDPPILFKDSLFNKLRLEKNYMMVVSQPDAFAQTAG